MRRLYLQIYLTIVASLILVVLTAGILWHFTANVPPGGIGPVLGSFRMIT